VNFNAPLVYFDRNGTINNPGSLTYSGVWANKRVSELLPLDYEPEPAEQPIDSSLFKKVNDKLEAYKSGHPIEKVYLHFDKPYYAAGDTIYFKAYVIDPTYKPSVLSSLLNAELISPDNTICQSIKLKLADCTAAGDFALPDTLPEGYYRLRAYTNVMRNAGEEYFFEKYMFIVNNPKNVLSRGKERYNTNTADGNIVSSNSSTAIDKIDVQFFPEGGKLINGAASKIAFKAVGPNGLGIEIKGTVTDDQGHQLAVFTSQHLGMGLIEMTPETGRVYKANISYIGGSKTYELPEADDNGYSLVIDNTDSRNIGINVTSGLQNQQRQIYLVAQSGGVIYFYTPGTLVNRKFATIIPKSMFPDGIVQFTLFSAKGEPANERLVFIRNPAQLNLKLTSDRSVYQARQKTIINLEARDKDYKPITGNFSVSVTNETEVPVDTDNESTIFANLLLTSDLKGYVEKPNYYFKDESAKANSDLDVLLLTQGYHRFEWQQILTGRYPQTTFESEKTTTITGVLKNLNGKSVPYGKVSLLSVSKVFFSLDTVADGNGNFQFKHFPAIDGIRYIIQATDKELRKNTWVKIDEATPPELNKSKNVPDRHISPAGDQLSYLNFANNFHQEQLKLGIGKHAIALKEVVIKNKIKPKYLEHSSNLNGAGNANQVITADQLPRGCPVLTDCIAGRMGRIHFSKGTPYLIGMIGHNESAVFIDGVEITVPKTIDGMGPTKADVINSINVGDVASIEIITDASLAAIYGLRGGGGVILITTKRWDDVTPGIGNPRTHYVYYSPTAYYKARTFYSPRYDSSKINTPFADLRATIYWNPNVIVDKDGNAFLNFFNADTKGTYRVVIEGIDEKGNIGRQVYRYKVE
jgi:TonB-dependent SusC/RagA subfamily outer membrane receptor